MPENGWEIKAILKTVARIRTALRGLRRLIAGDPWFSLKASMR